MICGNSFFMIFPSFSPVESLTALMHKIENTMKFPLKFHRAICRAQKSFKAQFKGFEINWLRNKLTATVGNAAEIVFNISYRVGPRQMFRPHHVFSTAFCDKILHLMVLPCDCLQLCAITL